MAYMALSCCSSTHQSDGSLRAKFNCCKEWRPDEDESESHFNQQDLVGFHPSNAEDRRENTEGDDGREDTRETGSSVFFDPTPEVLRQSPWENLALQELRQCIKEIQQDSSKEIEKISVKILQRLDFLEGKVVAYPVDQSLASALKEDKMSKGSKASRDHDEGLVSASAAKSTASERLLSRIEEGGAGMNEKKLEAPEKAEAQNEESAEDEQHECILQFSAPSYFCTEGEDVEMIVDVMRLGDDTHPCSCFYETHDSSAKAGEKYLHTSGTLQFGTGESLKSINIPLLDDDSWNATLEFEVELSKPNACQLGKYLNRCRVKCIDDDTFPTNRFAERIKQKVAKHKLVTADFALMLEYFKMNYTNPTVRKASIKLVIYGQVGNLYFIFQLLLTQHLIDKVLQRIHLGKTEEECTPVLWVFECPDNVSEGQVLLLILMLLFIIPYAFVHYFDYRRMYWKIGGASRKLLQANLLRKFLHYNEESRNQLSMSDLIMAINRDSGELASNGYLQIFPLWWMTTRLVFIVCLQMIIGTWFAIIPVLVFPIVLAVSLKVRSKITRKTFKERNQTQNDMIGHVEMAVNCFRLIADFAERPECIDKFEQWIGRFNVSNATANGVKVNNTMVSSWLSILFIGLWFVIGGSSVLDGGKIGTFVTTLGIFKAVGASWSTIYKIILAVQTALVPLGRVTTLMNMKTDLEERKIVNRKRRALGEERRQDARRASKENVSQTTYAADRVPIEIIDVSYHYLMSDLQVAPPMQNLNAEFSQGSLVALVGLPAKGKTTVAKLIGSVIVPSRGVVAIPPHLRVLHISQQPVFFEGTLLTNLTYGVKGSHPDQALDRVMAICKRLRVPPHLLELLLRSKDEEGSVKLVKRQTMNDIAALNWNDKLSTTQRSQLNLARALINNPEVLVAHKPTLYFDEELSSHSFQVLRAFAHEKGLEQDPAGWRHRRPRTCVFTVASRAGLAAADKIFEVREDQMLEVNADQVSDSMLQKDVK